MIRTTLFASALFALTLLIAAPAARAGGATFSATLPDIQANVFTPSCAFGGCHGESQQAGLDLRDGNSFGSLVNVESVEISGVRVVPFGPDDSYLICKLEACPTMVANRMPLGGDALDQESIDVIREWILLGAPESPHIAVESQTWGRIKAEYR